ncbi:MAG: CdaR family protein [Kofleriaceae bacterium]
MRQRSQTIGPLGRSPARSSQNVPVVPTPTPSGGKPVIDGGVVKRWLHGALFENTGLKFLSLVLAVTVFLLINTDKDREITVRVGVRYDFPADKVLTSEQLKDVAVTIKGPYRRLRQFDERELNRIALDLHNATNTVIPFTPEMITNLPPGLSVTSISPPAVQVSFDKKIEKLVEVTPKLTGRPLHGYIVSEVKATPATVTIQSDERLLAALTTILTRDVSVESRIESFEQLVPLNPATGVTIDPTQQITVQVRIIEDLQTRTLADVAVVPRGDGIDRAKWQISPAQVEVTLTGPLLMIEKAKPMVIPIVKLAAGDFRTRDVEITLDGLPPGVGARIFPPSVKVSPVKPAPAPP